MVKIHKDTHNHCIFKTQKGTYCHPAHAVLSDVVKVDVKLNRALPDTVASAFTLHYCTCKSVFRSSLQVLCTMFFNIPSSDDKFHSVSCLPVVNQVFNLIFATPVDLLLDLPRLPSSPVTKSSSLNCHWLFLKHYRSFVFKVTYFQNHFMCL